jgi:hypothetical protein
MENVQRLPPLDRNANTGRADHITCWLLSTARTSPVFNSPAI